MSTHNIQFHDKIRVSLNTCFLEPSEKFRIDSKTSSNDPWKRAIGVRAVEVLL